MQQSNPLSKPPSTLRSATRLLRKPVWRVLLPTLLLAGTAMQAQAQTTPAAGVCVVTPTGTGTAASAAWSSAMSLASALAEPSCTEIWLQQGTYTQQAEAKGFIIARTLQLYGGFVGNETSFAARPAPVNSSTTVLDGENTRTVLYIDGTTTAGGRITGTTVLDGFSVVRGLATQAMVAFPDQLAGGGMYCNGSGANHECSPRMNNLVFSDNRANGSAALAGALFNEAGNHGTSSPSITNSLFEGNSAAGGGGAVVNSANPSGNSSPSFTNVTFLNNSAASGYGGAVVNNGAYGTSNANVSNSTFSGNSAKYGGAVINNFSTGNKFSGNIFWGNTATEEGAEVYNLRGGSATFSNNILQGSGGSANWLADLGTDGGGNLDSDPKLGPLQDNGGPTQTMLPGVGGSAIDAYACTPLTPAADQRGVARPQSAQCDAGAVELGLYLLTVSLTGTGNVQLDTPPKGASTAPACPTDNCSALAYFESQVVTLTASPASPAGSAFTGWSGDACAGSTSPGCSVTVNAAKTVTATFNVFTLGPVAPAAVTYGTAFLQTMAASGGVGPYTYAASNSSNAALSFDPSNATLSAPASLAVGTYTIDITATDSNGASTLPVTVNATVNPAPLTITANNASMVYGQALPAFTVSYSGWVNGETAASLNPPPAVTTTATAASPVGSYPITANGALNANYTIAYAPGTLTIGQAGQTLAITSTAPANAKVGGSYTVTTSGGGSTQPVVLSVSGDACSLAGSVVSFDTVGTCVITANQAGDGNFTAAQPVSQTVKVGQAASVITVESSHNPSLPGQEVTFSIAVVPDSTKSLQAQSSQAKAAPVPTGTVTLTDGATTLGTAPLDGSGKATLAVTSLTTPGAHNIVASYSGDASFPAAQSAVWIQTVNAASVSAPTPVPSLSNLALVLLSAMAAGFGGLALRLRRKTAQA